MLPSPRRLGRSSKTAAAVSGHAPTGPVPRPERFGVTAQPLPPNAGRSRTVCFAAAILLLAAGAAWSPALAIGAILLFGGFVLPSRTRLAAMEAHRAQTAALAERDRRLLLFKARVAELLARTPSPDTIRATLMFQKQLSLTDAEAGRDAIERLKGAAEFLEFKAACGGPSGHLPPIIGHDQMVSPDNCYFVARATRDKRGDHVPWGTLYLTSARTMFKTAEGLTAAPWTKVIAFEQDGRALRVQRSDRQTPYVFVFSSYGEAMKAYFVGRNLWASVKSSDF